MASKQTAPRKVLIIGGGFAGLECARKLANDKRFDVTLLDRTNHHLFQPLLYQVATASLAAPDIARSIRQILAGAKNVTVLMDEVTAISPSQKTVTGKTGDTYTFDYLVLAAGAKTGYFGNDQWEENSLGLKSLADAQDIRRKILSNLERAELTEDYAERERLMTIGIVGGGPTGVELAGACADLVHRSMKSNFRRIDTSKLRIILIQSAPKILVHYGSEQSDYAMARLQKLGVEILTETRVTDVQKGKLLLNNGSTIEAEAIVWAAGVAANPLTKDLGVETDRGGRVTPKLDLSVPGHPDIFVAGDLTNMRDRDDKLVPGVAPAASQMGNHIAALLKEELRLEKTGFADRKHILRPLFKYNDKGMMAIIGKNAAVVKVGKINLNGSIAWIVWLLIHILFLIGFRNKLSVLLGWAYSYIVNNPEARLIVHPPASVAPPHK
ncbi:MAG: NAD(P)/FAD-dependent oxidoreductase [Verrucomicrobia bacterium]|jgi:NADH dehydrogenase|nr:NAD(P)/FAD-dependent oxidoreductase [Verrucomicrobiota bacterium]|tara:strand:- start:2713 stop:4032 length:1320 start_codon:yes stop_codon:yes gene_type:complete